MTLAPIVLFVYNRPWHTQQTLNALANNLLAPQSILYIYADGPKSSAAEEQRKNLSLVRELIKNETRFKQVFITEASSNQGLANSVIAGVTAVVKEHNSVIILEDDMITAPAFLSYMNDALHKFKDQDVIGSINAFVDYYNNFNKLNAYFLLNGADCWGWATWKNRWDDFIPDALMVKNLLVSNKKLGEFDYGNTISMLDSQINGVIDSWHIRWHGSQIIKGRFGLFPNKSFVLNIGTDGSGTHLDAYDNHKKFEVSDLNLYNISIHNFDLSFLLKNHKKDEKRFKKALFKNMKGSHLYNLRNMIIKKIRLLLGKSSSLYKMIKQILKRLFKEFIYINNYLYILRHQLSEDNKIFTHLTIDEKITLHKIIKNISNTGRIVCVEIGSYLGASSCFIANALNNNSVLYCIDTWENDAMIYSKNDDDDSNLAKKNTFEEFLSNTKNYISKIKMLKGWSYLVVIDLKTLENYIDFIFIDGDHNYDGVKKDWDTYKPLLKKGSLITLHDTGWAEGVNQIIKEDILPIATIIYTLPNLMVLRVND